MPLRIGRSLLIAVVLGVLSTACEPAPVVIPEGAQVVHVTATDDAVDVSPATVEAGDVYLVMEGPATGIALVRGRAAADAEPTGMSPADIERIRRGDYQSTQIEGLSVSCAPEDWTEEDHWQGCHENVRLTLGEGLYAILGPGGDEPGVPPVMDVLEVVP